MRPAFDPRPVCVGILWGSVALTGFCPVTSVTPVSTILPMLVLIPVLIRMKIGKYWNLQRTQYFGSEE